jgi:hypothetical protein
VNFDPKRETTLGYFSVPPPEPKGPERKPRRHVDRSEKEKIKLKSQREKSSKLDHPLSVFKQKSRNSDSLQLQSEKVSDSRRAADSGSLHIGKQPSIKGMSSLLPSNVHLNPNQVGLNERLSANILTKQSL